MSGPGEIDTTNLLMVGIRGRSVVVPIPMMTGMTPVEALVHAAWLVAMADILDPGAAARFAEVYAAVVST